jgi:hypothetical protein
MCRNLTCVTPGPACHCVTGGLSRTTEGVLPQCGRDAQWLLPLLRATGSATDSWSDVTLSRT